MKNYKWSKGTVLDARKKFWSFVDEVQSSAKPSLLSVSMVITLIDLVAQDGLEKIDKKASDQLVKEAEAVSDKLRHKMKASMGEPNCSDIARFHKMEEAETLALAKKLKTLTATVAR